MEQIVYQILRDWHELLKNGVITEAEFENKKRELLIENNLTTTLPEDTLQILPEEEPNSSYHLLNNQSWINKNKTWLIVLFLALILGSIALYFINSSQFSAQNDKSINSAALNNGYYIIHASNEIHTYFYWAADINRKRSAYFAETDTVYLSKIYNGFGYIKFANSMGKTSKGWIPMQGLEYCANCGIK